MHLKELTNVHVLDTAQAQTIKGGARDTRTVKDTATYTLPIR